MRIYEVRGEQMIERITGLRSNKRLLIGMAIVIGTLAGGRYVDQQGLSYRELIIVLGGISAAIIVFGGARGIRFGFVLWVLTLALGYRTIEWTNSLRIHPSEILIWLLIVCVFAQRQFRSTIRFSLPWWLLFLIPFWALAWWPLIAGD